MSFFIGKLEIIPIKKRDGVLSQMKLVTEKGSKVGRGTENGIWLFWDKAIKEKASDYLKRIEVYEKDQTVFKSIKYSRFKKEGRVLEPGMVIRADRLREKYSMNKDNDDPLKTNRPYLIWKIEDNRMYCFPLASKMRNSYQDGYLLPAERYPNHKEDRKLKDKIVCITESDVQLVDDKVSKEDFDKAIEFAYIGFCYNQIISRSQIREFMTEMSRKIGAESKDVIVVNDFNQQRLYFVLERDNEKQNYEVIEVDKDDCGDFYLASDKKEEISMDSNIIDVLKLSYLKKDSLVEQINKLKHIKIKK